MTLPKPWGWSGGGSLLRLNDYGYDTTGPEIALFTAEQVAELIHRAARGNRYLDRSEPDLELDFRAAYCKERT